MPTRDDVVGSGSLLPRPSVYDGLPRVGLRSSPRGNGSLRELVLRFLVGDRLELDLLAGERAVSGFGRGVGLLIHPASRLDAPAVERLPTAALGRWRGRELRAEARDALLLELEQP